MKKINELGPSIEVLTHEELKCKTEEFKMRLEAGKDTLDSLLPEAFAVVREASRRVLNMRHFDVQLVGKPPLRADPNSEILRNQIDI